MRGLIVSILLLLIVMQGAWAAQIYGGIFDQEANSISKTEVFINSTPPQRHISKYGGYSFEVGPGAYKIVANLTQNNRTLTIAEQYIVVESDGEYRIDLSVDASVDLVEAFEPIPWYQQYQWTLIAIAIVIIVVLLLILITVLRRKAPREDPKVSFEVNADEDTEVNISHEVVEEAPKEPERADPLERRVILFLKKQGGQSTQKEIRKELAFSSAKVSMVLTDLQKSGKIHKEKKGRVNIIVLG